MAKYGNVGASSLVKSAHAIANQIADYKDKIKALEWSSSAQTDADWADYSQYLQTRMERLSNTNTLTNLSKAASMQSTWQSANRSYVSNSIQRTTIDIMEGRADNNTKLEQIKNLYYQATSNGDANLAQNLHQQYDSLYQQVIYERQQAYEAGLKLAEANAKANSAGALDIVDQLQKTINQISDGIKSVGESQTQKDLKSITSKMRQTLKAAGIDLPTGANLTIGSVVHGLMTAQSQAYNLAAAAWNGIDEEKVQTYMNKQNQIEYGDPSSKINIAGKSMSLGDAYDWATQPNKYFFDANNNLKESAINGYAYDANGDLVPVYTGEHGNDTMRELANGDKSKQVAEDLKSMGFQITDVNGDPIEKPNYKDGVIYAKISDNTNSKSAKQLQAKYGLGAGTIFNVYMTKEGYQFGGNDFGYGKAILAGRNAAGGFSFYDMSKGNNITEVAGVSTKNPALATPTPATAQPVAQKLNTPIAPKLAPLPSQPSTYTNPSSIKPGSSLTSDQMKQAQNAIGAFLKLDKNTQTNTYNAISKSAGYGNPYDQYKLKLLKDNNWSLTGNPLNVGFGVKPIGG